MLVLSWTGLGLLLLAARFALDRHVRRSWARAWAEVEPRWSGRRRG